jgi:very-short-patch-repair endonuclease
VWESRVLRELRRRGFPDPSCNHRVRTGGRVRYLDFAWPDRKVAVEFDGFELHALRRAVFDDDRARQNDLVDDGWRVYRLTSTALERDAASALAPIARALARHEVVESSST